MGESYLENFMDSKPDKRPIVSVTRREGFNAAHRLHNNKLSDQENREIFGKCNNKNGHGHNYFVEITVEGPVDPDTGMVLNLTGLKRDIQRIIEGLDHKNLDLDVEYFKNVVSSAENIAVYFWDKLNPTVPAGLLKEVKLYETSKNIAVYRGKMA